MDFVQINHVHIYSKTIIIGKRVAKKLEAHFTYLFKMDSYST